MEGVQKENQINYEFKIFYFFGMLFIVACHCGWGGISLGYDWFYPGAFHLAMFAFGSGYFYKREAETCVGKYIWKKVKRLLIPMYLWNLVYGIIAQILQAGGIAVGGELSLYNLLIAPLNSGHQFGWNFPTWFVAPLFMIEVFNVIFRKIYSKIAKVNEWVVFLIYLAIGILGAWCATQGWHSGWKVAFVRAAYLLPFYTFGKLYQEKLEKRDTLKSICYFAILFFVQLLYFTRFKGKIYVTLVWGLGFENGTLLTHYILGAIGIAFWLRISKLLMPLLKKSKVVLAIADNTFSIMNHHVFVFFIINTGFALVAKYTTFCQSFDWSKYRSTMQWIYFPEGLPQYKMIYLVAGLLCPILIQYGVNWAKSGLKKIRRNKNECQDNYSNA